MASKKTAKPTTGKRAKTGDGVPAAKAVSRAKSGSPPLLAISGAGVVTSVYRPKTKLFRQGDPTGSIFQIREGKVQISIVSKAGKAAVIALLGPGDFVGEGALAGQPVHLSTATALVETEVTKFSRAAMVELLHDPRVSDVFTAFLLSRYIEIEADLVDQLFNSTERRLARVLLLLANFGKDGKMESIPKISQELLAARVGTTRSRVNFFMNKFRKLGLIEYNGGLKVHSALMNIIVHD